MKQSIFQFYKRVSEGIFDISVKVSLQDMFYLNRKEEKNKKRKPYVDSICSFGGILLLAVLQILREGGRIYSLGFFS